MFLPLLHVYQLLDMGTYIHTCMYVGTHVCVSVSVSDRVSE